MLELNEIKQASIKISLNNVHCSKENRLQSSFNCSNNLLLREIFPDGAKSITEVNKKPSTAGTIFKVILPCDLSL